MLRLSVQQILEAIQELSAPELQELAEACSRLGIFSEDQLFLSMPTPNGEWLEAQRQDFDFELTSPGNCRTDVIKIIRETLGFSLLEAKEAVSSTPVILKENVPRQEADVLRAKLEAAGATVSLK